MVENLIGVAAGFVVTVIIAIIFLYFLMQSIKKEARKNLEKFDEDAKKDLEEFRKKCAKDVEEIRRRHV